MLCTSGWQLCALLGGLMVCSAAGSLQVCGARSHCSALKLLSFGLPIHKNVSLSRLLGEIKHLYRCYEEVENMEEKKCPPLNHIRDVCFPVRSAKCEDKISACVLFESLKVAVAWMKDVGHTELMCWMELVRSHFKNGVIPSYSCEGHKPNLNNTNSYFEKKCIKLEILSKLRNWLNDFLSNSVPELSHVL